MRHRPPFRTLAHDWRAPAFLLALIVVALVAGRFLDIHRASLAGTREDAARRAATRTHYAVQPPARGDGVPLLPDITQLAPDGLRMVVDTSFLDTAWAVAIRHPLPNGPASGELLVMRDAPGTFARQPFARSAFTLSGRDHRMLTRSIDLTLANYPGEAGFCLDGTHVWIERAANGSYASIDSNCAAIGETTAKILLTTLLKLPSRQATPSASGWADRTALDAVLAAKEPRTLKPVLPVTNSQGEPSWPTTQASKPVSGKT
ncbi:hypothetical protein ACFSGX_12845 [Sphingomonas arantia]|uniref:Uncharacterized protein n=1 Tax=Sphingomonas arantia TaxID=1460676 RepID=A0ABW4U0S3_9SPHN